MKKTNKLFLTVCMVSACAFIFGSCKKNDTEKSVIVNLPQFEEEVDGRAYVDFATNKFKWNANDQVAIYNLNFSEASQSKKAIYATNAKAEGKTSATFTFQSGDELGAKMDGYFVFYPVAKLGNGFNANNDNREYFTVSNTQTYTVINNAATVDPEAIAMACTLNSLDGNFTLKHIFGNLRLKMKGTGNVTKVVVEDTHFNLAGTVSMKIDQVDMNTFSSLQDLYIASDDPYNAAFGPAWAEYANTLGFTAEGTDNQVTLNCPDGVQLNETTETHFFIGLRPGALKYGFKVYVYVDGATLPSYTFDYTGANNLHYGIKAGVNKGLSLEGIN